ncbi:hypothetical protein CROQUDRAFT_664919, partial [Cronartium quercuum f. sp. fusiforme G11]
MSLVYTVVTPAQVGLTSCYFYLEELCPEPIKIKSTIYEEGQRLWKQRDVLRRTVHQTT